MAIRLSNTTILIVEDDKINAMLLTRYLQKAGYNTVTAINGEEALNLAPKIQPGLILLDVMMPGIDGFETCRRLQTNAETNAIPIIFMTARAGTPDVIKGFELGAVDYITKPFEFAEVSARINIHLSLQKLQQDLHLQNDELRRENVRRQQAEHELERARQELEQRVQARTAELAQVNANLQAEIGQRKQAQAEIQAKNKDLARLDRLKDEFFAHTSHQLRTPLTGIVGIAESMLDGATGALTPNQMYNLSILVSSGQKLTNLVNDILDLSRLKHRELNLRLKAVDIRAVTEIVCTLTQPAAYKKNLQLNNKIPANLPLVQADENRIQQIVYNLLDNAIKFTDTGHVSVQAAVKAAHMTVTIADTGSGIPAEQCETIFQTIDRVEMGAAYEDGGLGLPITKQLVELHGGVLRVKSVPGQGSEFTFTIPLAPKTGNPDIHSTDVSEAIVRTWLKPVAPKQPTTQELAKNKEFTILVVDDDLSNVQMLTNYLSLQNYGVAQAFDGQEALEAFADVRPDLILLDTIIPKLSGYEVCRTIRHQYPPHELPIIMLATKTPGINLVAGFEVGANDYLYKPFDKNELLSRVKTHLQLTKITAAYGRFVPHEFLQFLQKESIVDVHLGDQIQRNMTILFADIRAFTSLSENMTPQENFKFLNEYLRRVSPIIRQHHGFIDKYIGDTIMALFPRQAEDALQAAVAMQKEITRYNLFRQKEGQPPIRIGVGVHTGQLMLGTVGEAQRMESTVISDAVNLASRLEGLTKIYGASIIASSNSLFQTDRPANHLYRYLDWVQVTGKQEPVSVFEIFSGESQESISLKLETNKIFETGLLHYHSQEFAQAHHCFEQVLAHNPADKATQLYLKRTAYFMEHGAPPDWVGVETLTHK